jgi:hypothetical protein
MPSTGKAAPPRRESSATTTTTTTSTHTRPGMSVKSRAYSAPMISKSKQHVPRDDSDLDELLGVDPADTEEIAMDPFFQRYNIAQRPNVGQLQTAPNTTHDDSSDTEGPLSPTQFRPRGPGSGLEPLPSPHIRSPVSVSFLVNNAVYDNSIANIYLQMQASETNTMQEINIGVLGAAGVGKTTFVQRMLELRNRPTSAFSARKMAIDNNIYLVRLVELPFDDITIDDDEAILWPDTIEDLATPRIDGAFTMYDVMNQNTLAKVPEILSW